MLSRRQFVQQRLRLFQIERIKALGEPAVDRREQIAGLMPLALIAPEPRHARRGRSHNRSPRLARRSAGDAAAEHTLVPTKQLPLLVHECPSQRKAHKSLPKTSITRFATKSGEARDVARLAHD